MSNQINLTKDKYIVTNSLPYVNSIPHVGFAMETLISDSIARFLRTIGKEVVFVTGTDDNSFKLSKKAKICNQSTREFVDNNAVNFLNLSDKLNLSNNIFYTTSTQSHEVFINKFIKAISKDSVYKGNFKSYFCPDCEAFFGLKPTNDDLVCQTHHIPYDLVDEDNYFLKVTSNDKDNLLKNLNKMSIIPNKYIGVIEEYINNFNDYNFTRKDIFGWGLKFYGDNDYVFYSFFDALLGYVAGANAFKNINYWNLENVCIIQNIGRDILKFHSVTFPHMLLKAGYKNTPDSLIVHGFINRDGMKMSKSKNNFVSVDSILEKYHPNVLRLYLLSQNFLDDFEFDFTELDNINYIYKKYIDSESIMSRLKLNSHVFEINNIKQEILNNFANLEFKEIINAFFNLLKEQKILSKGETDFVYLCFQSFVPNAIIENKYEE